ncbi:hypothetical protein GQ53DRAFT_235893 [Thozetella sp. PMI_491]|nr:hypothetical protein GQ53DRAFT_235893 [Thozetella sp. PMI_491]
MTPKSTETSPVPNISLPTTRRPKRQANKRRSKPAAKKLYAIRGILQEERRAGKLFYQIDWEDDPETGESYDPTWEPSENANPEAVADWTSRRTAPPPPSAPVSSRADSEDLPLQLNKHRKRPRSSTASSAGSQKGSKRRRDDVEVDSAVAHSGASLPAAAAPRPGGQLVVELSPHSSLDPSAYVVIDPLQSQSQPQSQSLSQEPPRGSQSLPAGSQGGQRKDIYSLSTIPDSQEFSQLSLSQWSSAESGLIAQPDSRPNWLSQAASQIRTAFTDASGTPTDAHSLASTTSEVSQRRSESALDIPSRQPDHPRDSFQTVSASIQNASATSDKSIAFVQPLPFPSNSASSTASPCHGPIPLGLTRLVNPISRIPESSQIEQENTRENNSRESSPVYSICTSSGPDTPRDVSALTSASPPPSAQIFPPLGSNQGVIFTESEESSSSNLSEGDSLSKSGALTPGAAQRSDKSQSDSQASRLGLPPSEPDENTRHRIIATRTGVSRQCSPQPSSNTTLRFGRVALAFASASGSCEGENPSLGGVDNCFVTRSTESRLYEQQLEPIGPTFPRIQTNMATSPNQEPSLPSVVFPDASLNPMPDSITPEVNTSQALSLEQALISPSTMLPLGDSEPLASGETLSGQPDITGLLMDPALDPSLGLEPSSIIQLSAVDQLKQVLSLSPEIPPSLEMDGEDATVAPADLSTALGIGIDMPLLDVNLGSGQVVPEGLTNTVLPGIEIDSPASVEEDEDAQLHFSLEAYTRPLAPENEFWVTLPLATSTRHFYLDTILRHKETMTSFGEIFQGERDRMPDESLVAKIDKLFDELYDLCDLPAYAGSLPDMADHEMKKHATGTNSKYSFVFEFLDQIRDTNAHVLIISRPGRAFIYLDAILASGFDYDHLGAGPVPTSQPEGLFVTLASSDQEIPDYPVLDVVINFDHTARDIRFPNALCVLYLVAACTIEHIDLKLTRDMDPMERRNAMNYATVVARKFLDDNDGDKPRPHEAAQLFADYINNPSASSIEWEPEELPDLVFDFWLNSQASADRSQQQQGSFQITEESAWSGGRKRELDADVEEVARKRAKRTQGGLPKPPPQLSDLLRSTLQSCANILPDSNLEVEVNVAQLESMAAKIFELEERVKSKSSLLVTLENLCKSQEMLVKSHERTTRKIAAKYYEALSERGVFEKEHNEAVEQAQQAKKRAEESKAQIATLKAKIPVLEGKLVEANATLSNSSNPEIARFGELAKELDEARAKVQSLEKRVASVQNEAEYSRQAYQDASNRHSELSSENAALAKQVAELEKLASDNLVKIHQIQAENERLEDQRMMEELRAIAADRERELERVREELRVLRNGRRETRQASVPRSPRMGVLSPRNGRATGGGSRGTSPTLEGNAAAGTGMSFLSPGQSNGRWDHLHNY